MKTNIYEKVANRLGYDEKLVKEVFDYTWMFIREKIGELPLKETEFSEDDFKKLKASFNLPRLGKLGCTYKEYYKHKQIGKRKRDDKDDKCETENEQGHHDDE